MDIGVRAFSVIVACALLGACEGVPACPEQPPPLPPMPVVSYRSWAVLFESGSTRVIAKSLQTLDDFAAKMKELGTPALVEAHTDRIGDSERNFVLSWRRALAVRDALVRRGVPAEKILLSPRGDRAPIVPKPRGVPEAMNDWAQLRIPDGAWPSRDTRPWPPEGYVKTTMRCVMTEELLVPIGAR